jgi:hypothetical protein
MWQITNEAQTVYYTCDPVLYTKVAFGFLSLYNSTFAKNMVSLLEEELPSSQAGYYSGWGYLDGTDPDLGSNSNGLIIEAALYAIQT